MPRTHALAIIVLLLACPGHAQEFRIQDVASISAVPVERIAPRAILFADQPSESLIDKGTGLVRFEDWERVQPLQSQILSLYPGSSAASSAAARDAAAKHYRENLHMYVAEARFVLSRPATSLDLSRLVTMAFVEQIDPAIKHRLTTAADFTGANQPRLVANASPPRRWCDERDVAVCIHSRYRFEGRLPMGIQLLNKLREGSKKIADYVEFDSELTLLSPAELDALGLTKLTGLETPFIGAVEQSIFHVNQVMEFGKLLAVFQQHPSATDRIVASVFMGVAVDSKILLKKKEYGAIPILRNLVPAQVLAGKSSFNTGNSLSAGLPTYARNRAKAIATMLESE